MNSIPDLLLLCYYHHYYYYYYYYYYCGCAVAQLFEELRYKPEGRGLDSRRSHWDFSLTVVPGSTHLLTEMSTRGISGGYERLMRRADNLTTFVCCLAILGASPSCSPKGLFRPVKGYYFFFNGFY